MRAPAAKSSRGQWVAVGAVLLAAGIVGLLVMPARVDRRVAALGQVTEPPAYVGMSVRGLRGRADSLFDAAMTAYGAHRYDAAASGLRAALAAGVDSVPAEFFLASAELMDGHPQAAADTYARVIAVGSAAAGYLPEAHLYRGRALLQLGRTQDAVAELKAVDASDPASAKAAALLDSVTRVLKR
jgi:predicted Zn-dependent protease